MRLRVLALPERRLGAAAEIPYLLVIDRCSAEDMEDWHVPDGFAEKVGAAGILVFANEVDLDPAADVRTVLADVYRKVLGVAGIEPDQATIDRLVTELMPDVELAFAQAVRKAGES